MKNYNKIILISLFLLIISLPMLANVLPIDPPTISHEQKALPPQPHIPPNMNTLLLFSTQFQKYFDTHFHFRKLIIKTYAIFKIQYLKSTINDKVVLAPGGWLFKKTETVTRPYPQKELKKFKTITESDWQYFNKKGIKYFVIVAPVPQSIYPEYYPSQFLPKQHWDQYSQLYQYMKSNSKLDLMIDVKEDLLKTKKSLMSSDWPSLTGYRTGLLYNQLNYRTNDRGGYVVYNKIIDHLKSYYPCLTPIDRSSFKIKKQKTGQDLANFVGLWDYYHTEQYVLKLPADFHLVQKGQCRNLTLVIVGDCMLRGFVETALEQTFPKMVFINSRLPQGMILTRILRAHPDIVINETIEFWPRRLLDNFSKLNTPNENETQQPDE